MVNNWGVRWSYRVISIARCDHVIITCARNEWNRCPDMSNTPPAGRRDRNKIRKKEKNQIQTSPRDAQCLRKRGVARGLVKMLAGISEVGIQLVQKVLLEIWSQIKWCRMSMCLEREVIDELFARAQALWLSERMGKGRGTGKEFKVRKRRIQRASFIAWVME